jgi:hypothetical protein
MMSPSTTPILVVDRIWRDPQNEGFVHAQIHLGGHPLQVILNFASAVPDFVEHVEMPWMLASHQPSQQAVFRLMSRYQEGGHVDLPVDLSEEMTRSDPPSPFRHDPDEAARCEQEAASVDLDLTETRHTGTYPCVFRGVMRVNGEPVDLEVEVYAGSGRIPVMRLIRTSRTLTVPETRAVRIRLLRDMAGQSAAAKGTTACAPFILKPDPSKQT